MDAVDGFECDWWEVECENECDGVDSGGEGGLYPDQGAWFGRLVVTLSDEAAPSGLFTLSLDNWTIVEDIDLCWMFRGISPPDR